MPTRPDSVEGSASCKTPSLGPDNPSGLAHLSAQLAERTRQLELAEHRFSTVFNANPSAQSLIALDPFEVLEVNPEFTRQFGITAKDIQNEQPETFRRGLDPARFRALIARLQAGEEINEHPFVFERGPGDIRDLRCSARLISIAGRTCSLWIMRDVTEYNHLENQFRQAQKMDAIGQLAAGVAHDFNNLLTVIQGYTTLVLGGDAPVADLVRVLDASGRAAALTRQLLLFSSRQITKPEPVNLGTAFREIKLMLARLLPERISLEWRAAEPLPLVLADLTNLEQVVMNLVINARDATLSHGVITVAIDPVRVADPASHPHPKARAGSFVCLSVGDTGSGMTPEVMAKIFEPFFTTKEIGKGTGLGLSTVYGIVDQLQGWVEVTSEPGQGTTFKVYFPAIEGSSASAASAPAAPAGPAALRGVGERILIVEDDAIVRSTLARIARASGYDVTEAEDGLAALRAWGETKQPFALVLTDVEMPNGMSGIDLAVRLRRANPEQKIILSTGYSDRLLGGVPEHLGELPLLSKPFTREELLTKLQSTLKPA